MKEWTMPAITITYDENDAMKYRRQVQTRKTLRTTFFFGKWSENKMKSVLSKIVNKDDKSRWIGCSFLAAPPLRVYITFVVDSPNAWKYFLSFFPYSSFAFHKRENHWRNCARLEMFMCHWLSLHPFHAGTFPTARFPTFPSFPNKSPQPVLNQNQLPVCTQKHFIERRVFEKKIFLHKFSWIVEREGIGTLLFVFMTFFHSNLWW
jgi:hypothetical protein